MLTYLNDLAERLTALTIRLEKGDNTALKDCLGPATEAALILFVPGVMLALLIKIIFNLLT